MIRPAFQTQAFVGILLMVTFLAACSSEQEPSRAAPTLTPYPPFLYLGLSEAASPLAGLVSGPYEAESGRPAPRFIVGNDETLLTDLEQGGFDAVIVHDLPPGNPHWFSPVALDGLVFFTHPDVGIGNLSASQIQAIYGGSIVNWISVGGPDLPIKLYGREAGSGASELLQSRIMENVPLSSLTQIVPGDEYIRQAVASEPGADGPGVVQFEGFGAEIETVAEQSYPLTTPIYFVSKDEPKGALREFLAWLQSPDGQIVLGENYGQVR